jgi:hypothetical protein
MGFEQSTLGDTSRFENFVAIADFQAPVRPIGASLEFGKQVAAAPFAAPGEIVG